MTITFLDSLQHISKEQWLEVIPSACPFLQYDFFLAMENSQSASKQQGWQPYHLMINNNPENTKNIDALLPLYIKEHSWGEYVFDWSWADAYERNNLAYYPKLVSTIPFTPIPSNKLFSENVNLVDIANILTQHCQQHHFNSWHILYTPEHNSEQIVEQMLPDDVYQRNTVQFHWFNQQYKSFDNFLATFTARKRKNTRKERLSISQQGIKIRQLQGKDITEDDINFFYLTYQLTYLKKGHQPHLTHAFFKQVLTSLHKNTLLVIASNNEQDIACALFFYDDKTLYGRYWGCSEEVKNLHFELCYYQGIEFCIKHKLQSFNPGTQGEHKIKRGFEPVLTHSYHWIKHPAFKDAIKDFCQQERQQIQQYVQQCQLALPFKQLS